MKLKNLLLTTALLAVAAGASASIHNFSITNDCKTPLVKGSFYTHNDLKNIMVGSVPEVILPGTTIHSHYTTNDPSNHMIASFKYGKVGDPTDFVIFNPYFQVFNSKWSHNGNDITACKKV